MIRLIHDCKTGEIIEQQLTSNEIMELEKVSLIEEKLRLEKHNARLDLLNRLNITEDDLRLILGD